MKKKRFLWILMILIIGFIPIVFFGCTSKAENNIELKEITGVLSSNSDLPYVNLAVSDEEIPSQCVIAFQITNYRDEISKEVYFSSDSNAISISNKTYYPNGVVEITINAETGGTALVTATSAQFSKDFTFAVNVLEHITSIEIKNDKNTIYYERGSELVVDLKEYINFLPKTTTERGLIATINGGGKVTPLDDNNRIVLSEISNDCVLSVQSEILTDSASQKINIKVVEKIEEISFQKEVFSSNGQKYDEDFEKDLNKQFVIELLKNNKAKTVEEEIVSYSSRIVKMHIQTTQENLKVSSKVYVKYNSEWIKVDSLVGDIITKFEDGEYISTINFTYEGYEELKYVLSFSYENYVYSETQEIIVKAVEAPNSLTINNVQSLSHSIDVYSKTNNYAGKALKFGVNKNAGKNFLINLYFNEEIGTSKSAQTSDLNGYSNKITLANNETIRVFATGENENSTMLARVYFEFENVEYYFESTINVTIKHNPDNVVIKEVSNLSSVTNSISSYNLDLNTTGIRINENGEQVPNYAQNSKTFYVFGRVNGSLENNHNFTVSSNIACVDVEVDLQTKSFTVTAKSVGTGRFYVTLESGERITFTVNVINSLSELNLSFPTPIQNRNLLETNINGDVYEIIAKTGTMIPVNYSYVGNAGDFNVSGNNLTYSNGNLTCNVDTEGYIYATFSCKSSYLDEQNKIKQITNNIPFKIKFFTPISSFSLSTNKGSNAINLYDLNTVGYYSYNLASVVITVNVDPNGIKEKILPNIVWTHNFEEELELIKIGDIENGDYIDKYSCALYTLEYNKQTGVASVLCNVDRLTLDDDGEYINNLNIVDEDGKLIIDNIILIAQIKGGEGADKYNAANYVSINISENTKVEQIVPSVEEISLDFYKKSIDLSTVIYPLDATNKQLSYTISNNLENLIEIEQTNGVFKISLKGNESDGASGVIRLIAKDSFTKESEYTTFVEIPIQISDGTAEFPYQIITSSDLNILTETGFSKHYQIVGNINASNVNFSNKTFSGVLFGINNATLSGINIISGAEESGSEGSTFNYGFFKEVTGTILNVKFAGKIELTGLVGACNIGLIAGKNSGRLQNVYAEVESISLTTKESGNTAKFNVGGVVGLNAGKILTNIQDGIFTFEGVIKLSLNYNKLADVKDLTFSNYLTTQTFYFGGVAGKSTGIIQVTISDGITEINNNFTSVNINISGKIQANTTAIGGVVGFVEKDTASEITPIISGLKVLGEINCSNNNIGGIAGSSTIDIKNCISRVKITGDENIGGIVGYLNNASVEECKVQNLQNSTILTGNSNIGGIAGIVENNGKIKKSTFISYIKDDSVYDIDVLGDNTNYGRIIGAGTLLGDFNVAIASISATGGNLNIQENKSKTAIFDRIGTGASYFDGGFINELLSDENTIETRYTFTNLQTFIEEIMAYEAEATEGKPKTSFIILPPTKIDLELTQNGLKQQLKNTNDATDETIVFYLINEEKINEETKTLADLTKYISAKANSNTGVIFASSNANILSFKDDGSAQLNGTGLVKITVTSEFNAEIENGFYVYVINNMTDFSAYRKADRMSSQITSATKEVLDKGTTYMLYFKFVEKYNSENFVEPNQINVALKIGDITYYPGDNEDGIRFLKISPEAYQLLVTENKSQSPISFVYYLTTTIGNSEYQFVVGENKINNVDSIDFKYKVVSLTKSLNISETDIMVMPYYNPTIQVELNTENTEEEISVKVNNITDPSNIELLNYEIFVDGNKIEKNSNKKYQLNKNFTIKFNLTDEKISEEYEFVVTISTSNRIKKQININFIPQTPSYVDVVLYEEKTDSPNNYQYYSSTKIVPSPSTSLLQVSLFPDFADYDYVIVKNKQTNEYELKFQLFDRINGYVEGAKYIDGGIKISKELIQKGTFELRMEISSLITDLSTVSILIDVFKDDQSVLSQAIEKTYYIEKLPGVSIEIDGVQSGNEESLLLAKNVEYSVNLFVKGYKTNKGKLELDPSTATYTDGEVKFKLNNAALATLTKNPDGTYSIKPLLNGELTISTYGEVVTTEGIQQSNEAVLKIQIVNFVVKSTNGKDIIKDSKDGVISKALGKEYTFEVDPNSDVLIYDKSDPEIINQVKTLLAELSKSTYVQVYNKNGEMVTLPNEDLNSVFELNNTSNNKLKITFKKLEDSFNPTYTFKFMASVTYKNNGAVYVEDVLVAGTKEENLTNIAQRTILQDFKFDVTEKTSRNNPYPINKPEDLNNMVEGNYYILLEDITLPTSFKPITTLVGGFDGNNHKITFPDNYALLNPNNDVVGMFGLFETVAENALIQNVIIEIPEDLKITLTAFAEVEFGFICAENYGNITNCSVVGKTAKSKINVILNDTINTNNVSNHIVGGLVARNNQNASITNSRVLVSISSTANLAGFVYENLGTISSSFVYGAVINNTTSTNSITAGFVGINGGGALTFASYIKGDYLKSTDSFATSYEKLVYSESTVGAFIHTNSGTISNCYANIPVSQGASRASGFVYKNEKGAVIEYSYSTSMMASKNRNHTAFIGRSVTSLLNEGQIVECFAMENGIISFPQNKTGKIEVSQITFANYELGANIIEGLKILGSFDYYTKQQESSSSISGKTYLKLSDGSCVLIKESFAAGRCAELYDEEDEIEWANEALKKQSTFERFAFSSVGYATEGIWFMPSSENMSEFAGIKLSAYKPELVSANILATTQKVLLQTIYDEVLQRTKYQYTPTSGDLNDPYIVQTYEDLEDIADHLSGNYRLVSNITYVTGSSYSNLYNKEFSGVLDGNSFTIGNYVIDSSSSFASAGFFGSLRKSSTGGVIKNTTFAPRYINIPNAQSVGAVVGAIYDGSILNVNVDGYKYDALGAVVLGKNAVGGLAGIAYGNYLINGIDINISVNAGYLASINKRDATYFDKFNLSNVSHAGLILGIASDNGKIYFTHAGGNNVAIAECAGLMFGYIGKNVLVDNAEAEGSTNQSIKANIYGGVIAGVSYGTIKNSKIIDESNRNSFFVEKIHTPIAVGNIVGYMVGGTIQNVQVQTSTIVQSGIWAVGGAVGIMQSGKIIDVIVYGNVSAGGLVGGLVGYVGEVDAKGFTGDPEFKPLGFEVKIENSYLDSKAGEITSTSSVTFVKVGTIIGWANGGNNFNNWTTSQENEITYSSISNNLISLKYNSAIENNKNYKVTINNKKYNVAVDIMFGAIVYSNGDSYNQVCDYKGYITNTVEGSENVPGSIEEGGPTIYQADDEFIERINGNSRLIIDGSKVVIIDE